MVKPLPGESENAFVVRAHETLADSMPDTDARNEAVYSAWRQANPVDKLAAKAAKKFPKEQFSLLRDVPVFCEHETVNSKGEPQHYGREELLAICDKLNHRIGDRGVFVKLSRGHTPDPDEVAQGAEMPEVLGYQGPYRIGQIGNDNPKYAIFTDEWWLKEHVPERVKLPGRSVEIWQHPDMSERFFDPVAALGAETPRLDMPIKFAKGRLGKRPCEVAKYAAVMPGDTNTYVPSTDIVTPKSKERYDMLSPEEIDQLASAIVKSMSAADAGGMEPGGSPDQFAADEMGDDDQYAAEEPRYDLDGPADKEDKFAAEECDDDLHEMEPSRMSRQAAARESRTIRELRVELARYRREAEDTKKRTATLEADKVAAVRYSKLLALQNQGYVFRPETKTVKDTATGKDRTIETSGLEREVARCRKMSDEQFADHLVMIAENYQRDEAGPRPMLFVPHDDPTPRQTSVADRAAASKEARERVEKYRREGKPADYATVLAEVQKERGIKIA